MNNTEFRRMVMDTPRRPANGSPGESKAPTGSALGSRMRSSIPMTPRTVKGATNFDFAQQMAARDAAARPQKKFRSSAAPRGTKLAQGYHDRTRDRGEQDSDDKAARIQALEEQMKLGQIDSETFERLRDNITGGDISSTHLVKGLDRQLLERVKRGEDVLSIQEAISKGDEIEQEDGPEVDPDAELERLEQQEIVPLDREKTAKKGEMAPPPPVAGLKRSRNDILAELKASRKAAEEAAKESQLHSRFRKIGASKASSRIERDDRGREILITVDEEGKVKRKVRKPANTDEKNTNGLLVPDKKAAPLGMVVPEPVPQPTTAEDDDDIDIFEGVGNTYNPLGDLEEDDNDASSSSDDEPVMIPKSDKPSRDSQSPSAASESPSYDADAPAAANKPAEPAQRRNYFNDRPTASEDSYDASKPFSDPTILAALKKAGEERKDKGGEGGDAGEVDTLASSAAAKRLLSNRDRDLDDMDLGFGSSRFGDEEEDEGGKRIKLSEWKGGMEDGEEEAGGRGGKQRKRGKKKRKGDKDSVSDVLGIIEGRKKDASK